MNEPDPLLVYNRTKERVCLRDIWLDCAAFLVCGGSSLLALPLERLLERGVLSMGVNNVAAFVPCTAFVHGDPVEKFHHGLWYDPTMMCFVPHGRRGETVRERVDGRFVATSRKARDCPATYTFRNRLWFEPESFFTAGATVGNNEKGRKKTGREHCIWSMFYPLRLLHYLGVRRVYLIGCDFSMRPEQQYAWGSHKEDGAVAANNEKYEIVSRWMAELRPVFEARGYHVFNCNERSGLRAFDFVSFDEALEDCRNGVPLEPFDLTDWYVPKKELK